MAHSAIPHGQRQAWAGGVDPSEEVCI